MDKDKVKILLVDDYQMVRVMMRRALGELGYDAVDEATDGREALAKIEASFASGSPYTIVFCDWMMEGISGIQVLEACRRSELMKHLPIVIVTAESEQKSVVHAMKAGANDYLVKPITVKAVEAKLDRVLSKLQGKSA